MSFDNIKGAAAAVNAVTNSLSLTALPNPEMDISLISNFQSEEEVTGKSVEKDEPEASLSLDNPTLETMTENLKEGGKKRIPNPGSSNSVLEILTVLGTSIKSETYRSSREVRNILDAGILNNRHIAVSIVSTKITLFSKAAIGAIRRLVHYYPSASLDAEHIELSSPYTLIAHCLKDLESFCAEVHETDATKAPNSTTVEDDVPSTPTCNKDTVEHLGILIDFVKEHVFKHKIEEEEKRHAQSLCTFRMLWLLFKPGDTVYVESGGRQVAYVVQSVQVDDSIMAPDRRRYDPYTITVWNLAFDGTFVRRANLKVYISHFEGERSITSLKVFPSTFLDQKDNCETRRKLEASGEKWYGLLRGAQMYYNGHIMSPSKGTLVGRVYIDSSSYYSQHGNGPDVGEVDDIGEGLAKCPCEQCHGRRPHPPVQFPWGKYDFLDPDVTESLVDEESPHGARHRYLICEGFVYGFVLKSKKWEKLDIECLLPPQPNLKAMESLVMPEDRKVMIKALVEKFSRVNHGKGSSKSWGADFIQNKGEECIAEFTGRALLSLTCGDIGTDEVVIEQRLSEWFRLAEKWGAVMLLDEADVFLERRQISDLKRNSLVSDFEVTMRAKKYILSQHALNEMEWNGREIRNIFQTAVALAEYRFSRKTDKTEFDGPVLDQQDFEQVCNMTQEFKQYLTNIRGNDEEERAGAHNDRFDDRVSGQ
ncbi:uncharacterized protein N7483_002839 [Penicillium malachiteum]|uniref:uncharacterized protein n=1 Tax=Penicillium malachiteum TaxID=1324776 RepID=UPI0025469C38|nr:uncharacterized protein N7483_002839 [Penicillium malachiteum]KAJ5737714.1 hypothetical protein N7483_002839 [Penicillium malachiteum]